MSALMDDLDLGNTTAEAVEQSVAGGGLPPEGLHHAYLSAFREVQANSGNVGWELTFTVLAGPGAGLKAEKCIWKDAGDADKKARARNQRIIFMHRLGLLKKVPLADGKHAYAPVEGKHSFADAYGTECVIEVVHEEETWTDKKGQQRKSKKATLTFEGVLSLDDPRAKDVPRAAAGAAAKAVAEAPPGANGQPADDFSDL